MENVLKFDTLSLYPNEILLTFGHILFFWGLDFQKRLVAIAMQ